MNWNLVRRTLLAVKNHKDKRAVTVSDDVEYNVRLYLNGQITLNEVGQL